MNTNRQMHRRVSRTDLDFEQALRAEGTVLLKEGVDVNTLGVDMSSSTIDTSFSSPIFTRQGQPSTPTVIPATPSPMAGPSTSTSAGGSSRSSSSQDVFFDAEDVERKTNRRSLYRSPGTSSSPDLATLVRKAKERGGVIPAHHAKREKRRESPPPPMPTSPPSSYGDRPTSGRPRSSTSHSANPITPQKVKSNMPDTSMGSEWVLPSPRSAKDLSAIKVSPSLSAFHYFPVTKPNVEMSKSSVRAKTSAFLGKMLAQVGTGSVRERSVRNRLLPYRA